MRSLFASGGSKIAGLTRQPLTSKKAKLLAASASALAAGVMHPAAAAAQSVPGLFQYAEENIAINLYELGELDDPVATGALESVNVPDGYALAEAIVNCASTATCPTPGEIVQYARGTESAANEALVGGALSIGAEAMAQGQTASAVGVIEIGLWQVAAADQSAQNSLAISGSFDIAVKADAIAASGAAAAFAAIGAGVSQIATSIGVFGSASNSIDNSGDLSIAAQAAADALSADATATAFVSFGIYQQAVGQAAAGADIVNDGNFQIDVDVSAEAANGVAFGSGSAAGIIQSVGARTQHFASSVTSGGILVGTTKDTPSGPASATLANSGNITIDVEAVAIGGLDARGNAVAFGVAQSVSGATAEAAIENGGAFVIAASADVEGGGLTRGQVTAVGFSQLATALTHSSVEAIDQDGVLTLELSSSPIGPAVASFANNGDILVSAEARVLALGTGSAIEGVVVANVEGLDQAALGDGAQAIVDNSGSFNVLANAEVDSRNIATGIALASGIDQTATAFATHATLVFANGSTTPSSFTVSGAAVGKAAALLDNSGSISILATVESHGDQVAFGGATASAVGQFAAGTEASVSLMNSGSITAIGSLSSRGQRAYGSVGAIGYQQAAQGTTTAAATFENGGTFRIVAEAEAEGELGAYLNATAFAGAQNVQSEVSASASIANSGTVEIGVVVNAFAESASAFDSAVGFGNAHGFGQVAGGQQAEVRFENSGTLRLFSTVDVTAGEFALASAVASGAIQQIALGSASGTAVADVDNSGSILVAAMAHVAAGSTAAAQAGVQAAIVQSAIAGNNVTTHFNNSGSIAVVADAEALAAGGEITDIASAQAFVFGINAEASATGAVGLASVNLANAGSLDINGMAHASGDGLAQAVGSAASGLVGAANVAGTGIAEVDLNNSGELTLVGMADATGGYTAYATAIAARGLSASGIGAGSATADIANSGDLALVADAHASAGTNAVAVAIAIDGFNAIAQAAAGDALSNIVNEGELAIAANASASALNAQAFVIGGGTLFSGGVLQSANAVNGDAGAIADNVGAISVVADALANGELVATASAVAGPGLNQFAYASSGDAFSRLNNSGSLEFFAHAEANADHTAFADAVFFNAVGQYAGAFGGEGSVKLTNEGSIAVGVLAEAHGVAAGAALAVASHELGQTVYGIGSDATVELDNSGSVSLDVGAIAEGSIASATVALSTGLIQFASVVGEGEATAALDNSGAIDMAVMAAAMSPDGSAGAFAELDGAISQFAAAASTQISSSIVDGLTQLTQTITPTGPASLLFVNSGSLDIAVAALAEGGTSALAQASGNAITQSVRGLDVGVSLVNGGSLGVGFSAVAHGDASAEASGSLTGIAQEAVAAEATIHTTMTTSGGQVSDSSERPVGTALASFENSGAIEITGGAEAVAGTGAASVAVAVEGLTQSVSGLQAAAEFSNEGNFRVLADARADGAISARAAATANGYSVAGTDAFQVDISNSGRFAVLAQASADGPAGQATANAIGMEVAGAGLLSGSIVNNGQLLVRAEAQGGSAAAAHATGIRIDASDGEIMLTNSGVVAVEAVTEGAIGRAAAVGLYGGGSASAAKITITNNGGSITAYVSNDGGTSRSRGTAIDLASASASSTLNLVGNGRIGGNIDLASGQSINVMGGETWFDGLINAECQGGGCGEGRVNIASGGALLFQHSGAASDGPSAAYVEELNIAPGGTLVFQVAADNGAGSYPQIVTDMANLDGDLLIRPRAGLYGDTHVFDNIIDANVRNGQFDTCGIDGNSPLLQLSCSYDGQGNVDLLFRRIAFHEVNGLTRNQRAVGAGIEAVYDEDVTGPFADAVGQLFTFGAQDYGQALTQLSGSSHAAYLQTFNSLGESHAQLVDRSISCELPGSTASSLSCRPGKLNLWGQLDYTGRRHDGDREAAGYDSDRWTAAIGGDVEVADEVIIGATIAKTSNKLDFPDGGRSSAQGIQIGGYGSIDRGNFYAKVIATLGWFDGDSSRRLDWRPFGGTLAGTLNGDADARLWTLSGHFGYRVAVSEKSSITSFLDIDHSSAKLDGFEEFGLAGVALDVESSTSSRTSFTLGAKWAADLGRLVPQAELGYRYLIGDRRTTIDAAFADQGGSGFKAVSAADKRGSLLAGLSIGGRVGPVDIRLGYQGLFNGNTNSHNANLRAVIPLGGN